MYICLLYIKQAFSSESESGSESEDDEKPSTTAVARRSDTEESETEAVATPGAPLNFSSELAKKLGGSAVSDPSKSLYRRYFLNRHYEQRSTTITCATLASAGEGGLTFLFKVIIYKGKSFNIWLYYFI